MLEMQDCLKKKVLHDGLLHVQGVFLLWGKGRLVVVIAFFFFPVTKMKLSKRLNLELIASYPVSNASLYPNADLV